MISKYASKLLTCVLSFSLLASTTTQTGTLTKVGKGLGNATTLVGSVVASYVVYHAMKTPYGESNNVSEKAVYIAAGVVAEAACGVAFVQSVKGLLNLGSNSEVEVEIDVTDDTAAE
jgi:hypothetical protein